jgi:hypothetical protein
VPSSRLGEDLVRLLQDTLRARLPGDWGIGSRLEQRIGRAGIDAVIDIRAPDGRKAVVLVEAKSRLDPKYASAALSQAQSMAWSLQELERLAPGKIAPIT